MAKINQDILISLIYQDMVLKAVKEHRFAAEEVGHGKGIRQRLKDADLKDWRFDVAIPSLRIAIEIEGGIHTGGRHTRGKGYAGDVDKYNAATVLGWKVLRYTHIYHSYSDVLKDLERLV